ncbi:MAG: hypothetical protein ACK5MZ_04625 [Aestuariibaculum sp.]
MDSDKLLELLAYTIPALITGAVAFYFFREHTKNEDGKRRFLLQKDLQSNALPLRLQAYERLTLFLERLKPSKLLIRVEPLSDNKEDYQSLLIHHIEQEFEHNMAQQIYVSEECWNIVKAAKNTTIQSIRKIGTPEHIKSANELRESILTEFINKNTPSNTALSFITEEVKIILS